MKFLWILVSICMSFGMAQARERIAAVPIDEAIYDESLIRFRAELLSAIERRDVDWIVSVAAENISTDIVIEMQTKADFAKTLDDAMSEDPNVSGGYFDEMKQALLHGGYFFRDDGWCEPFQSDPEINTQTGFIAPYTAQFSDGAHCGDGSLEGVYDEWSTEDYPGFLDVFFVNARNVNLRAEPDASSEVLRLLSYELVNADSQELVSDEEKQFVRVETWDHQFGYVGRDLITSYYHYSMALEKDNEGNWKIGWFGVQE